MSGVPSLTILSEEQKFNGDNLLQWNTHINQLLGAKGLLGYIDGKIKKPTEPTSTLPTPDAGSIPTSTPIYSSSPTYDEWIFRDQLTRGHTTLNCMDVASLGVVTTGTAKDTWDLIQKEWGRSTDMWRLHAQEALNRMTYIEGMEIQEHIKLLWTQKATIDNLSTFLMGDETWRGVIIWSILPTAKWLPVIPSLYTMSSFADIVLTLLAHSMIIGRDPNNRATRNTNCSDAALIVKMNKGCMNPNCKAKKQSTHTTNNCYWPGGGKEGQFPPNFGQRGWANVASSTPATKHFFLSACTLDAPGRSGILIDTPADCPSRVLISQGFQKFQKGKVPTFMDSRASDTMFVSRDVFTEYQSITPHVGDSAKAENGNFEIVGEGNIIQQYWVNGEEQEITYTCALHTLALNVNLISIGVLDKAGLTTTFSNGKGVTTKVNGTIVLMSQNVNGMYILETIDPSPDVLFAMASLSQPTSLKQWHGCFAHCSPSTIQDMVNSGLVDGLIITEMDVSGKCENCIMGQQTH